MTDLDRCRITQQGTALVECSLLCTVIIPMFFLLTYVGNIVDVKQTTIQASRYTAWEQTVNPAFRITTTMKARFYGQADVPLRTGQAAAMENTGVRGLWRVQNETDRSGVTGGTGETLVTFDVGGGQYLDADSGGGTIANHLGKGIHTAGKVLGSLDNADWRIEGDGLIDAGVQVNIIGNNLAARNGRACNGKQSARISGCVSEHNALLVDGWGVATNALAEQRTRALVPGTLLAKTGKALSRAGKIPFLQELEGLENAFGAVDSTVLPLDRYSGSYTEAHQ